MASESVPVDDKLSAALLAAALRLGAATPADVIRWADLEIGHRPNPPYWLIDLSLSHQMHFLDIAGLLEGVAGPVDPGVVFAASCSLLPDLSNYDFEACERLACQLYRLAFCFFDGNPACRLPFRADAMAETFALCREGYIRTTPAQVVAEFRAFVQEFRDETLRGSLANISAALAQTPLCPPPRQ